MYIAIPIPNLVLYESITLNNINLVSISNIIDSNSNCSNLINVIHKNEEIFDESIDSYAIYYTDENLDFSDKNSLVEHLIKPVDYALDCLRISLNSYMHHEQFVGIPGLYNGYKIVILIDDSFNFNQLIIGDKVFNLLVEGIGCDASDYTCDHSINNLLLSKRNDEVYNKYREILHRCCNNMQIYDTDNSFSYLFSMAESLIPSEINSFQKKKRQILSFISKDQNEFDILSQQFYFYSKVVRTEVFHNGKTLLEILDWKKVLEMLEDLHLLIVRFCLKAIKSEIKSFDRLQKEILFREKSFVYNTPVEEKLSINVSFVPDHTCDYYCEIPNLYINKIIKIGDVLLIPKDIQKHIHKIKETYCYGVEICNNICNDNIEIVESSMPVRNDFPHHDMFFSINNSLNPITVWDVDIIYTTILYNNINETTAVLEKQPYWKTELKTFSFDYTARFVDYICNKIQKIFDYYVLCEPFDFIADHLPPLVGINKCGIRGANIIPNNSNQYISLPGRVFGEYYAPNENYSLNLSKQSNTLYKCLFQKRDDEVFNINKNALHRLAQSYYFYDLTHLTIEVFNILDMLYPISLKSKRIINHIATFISKSQEEKLQISNELKELKRTIRDPIVHNGKSIIELGINKQEIIDVIRVIRKISQVIISYCENVFQLGVTNFEQLITEKERILKTQMQQ